jgi:hypothetical protein
VDLVLLICLKNGGRCKTRLFRLPDISNWALNSQEKINTVYISKVRLPDKVYPDTLIFFKGKDSQLYQNVLSYKLLRVQL